MQAKNSELEH